MIDPSTKETERELVQTQTITSKVLLVCRSPELRVYVQRGLNSADLDFFTVSSLPETRPLVSDDRSGASAFGLVLLEIEDPLPEGEAREIGAFCREHPHIPVIGIAPRPSPELVRDVMLLGLSDFLTNPFNRVGIGETARAALLRRSEAARTATAAPKTPERVEESAVTEDSDTAELPAMSAPGTSAPGTSAPGTSAPGTSAPAKPDAADPTDKGGTGTFITVNANMRRILEVVDRVAPTDSTVVIEGESGTGKELIARRIHDLSKRSAAPFVEVHCGAIPPTLLESQLFGHEKGSFTGAFARQIGLFEIANKGTIFLDEIAEMNLEMQVKLLRVLQEQSFRRIGGRQSIKVNVRVVAATNRNLKDEVEAKRFRADLYYRLNVISLEIPPLRERLEDIPTLIEFFAKRLHQDRGLPLKRFPPETVERLQKLRWIGNVREIENAVERLVLLSQSDEVSPEAVEEHLEGVAAAAIDSPFAPTLTLDDVKKIHISSVLQANDGNKMKTARMLGINVKTLYNLIQRLNIST